MDDIVKAALAYVAAVGGPRSIETARQLELIRVVRGQAKTSQTPTTEHPRLQKTA